MDTTKNSEQVPLSSNMEDYLEAIYHIERDKDTVRPKDIADRMHVSNASVTGALRSLVAQGMVDHKPYDSVRLTKDGMNLALDISGKHAALLDFFLNTLVVDAERAEIIACQMEHLIPTDVFHRFTRYLSFVHDIANGPLRWNDQTSDFESASDT